MKNFLLSFLFLTVSLLTFSNVAMAKEGSHNKKSPKVQSITIYPNPTQGQFKVQIENANHQKVSITIYNTLGKTILTENYLNTPANFSRAFNFEDEKSGLYFVSVQVGEKTLTKKVVVE